MILIVEMMLPLHSTHQTSNYTWGVLHAATNTHTNDTNDQHANVRIPHTKSLRILLPQIMITSHNRHALIFWMSTSLARGTFASLPAIACMMPRGMMQPCCLNSQCTKIFYNQTFWTYKTKSFANVFSGTLWHARSPCLLFRLTSIESKHCNAKATSIQ
jgi:hypothetical protein